MPPDNLQNCKTKDPDIVSISESFGGADGRIRTGDLILTKDALYLLSYISMLASPTIAIIARSDRKCKGILKIFLRNSQNPLITYGFIGLKGCRARP